MALARRLADRLHPRPTERALTPRRVWNGIFVAGDRRAKRDLMTMSPCRDRKSETTTREKWPQKPPSCLQVLISRFRRTGWWRMQSEKNRSPRPNSLLTGKLTGNLLFFGSFEQVTKRQKTLVPTGFPRKTPKIFIREILFRKQGISLQYQDITALDCRFRESAACRMPRKSSPENASEWFGRFQIVAPPSIMAKDGKSMNAKETLSCTVEAYLGSSSTPPGTSARINRSTPRPSR